MVAVFRNHSSMKTENGKGIDMKDVLLEYMFTHTELWDKAIKKGFAKDMKHVDLRNASSKEGRIRLYLSIKNGTKKVMPPHVLKVPKDDGTDRIVYANEPDDRIMFSGINDSLNALMPECTHPNCKSYQTGISCGKVVTTLSKRFKRGEVGWKADLSKYFDSVPIEYIDAAFKMYTDKYGPSKVIDLLMEYYHDNRYFDEDGHLQYKFLSLKQGCAVASWLANVILYSMDKELSELDGTYCRYCDDIIFVGPDQEKAMAILKASLKRMGLKLNPKKVEPIDGKSWVKFLGFSLRGNEISLSNKGIETLKDAIMDATKKEKDYEKALHKVYRILYSGYDDFSWATRVLRVVNVEHDLITLNGFVMDCLRGVLTGKHKVGGIGYQKTQKDGCIARGRGKNVKSNKEKIPQLEGYVTITCMANALRTSRDAYETLLRQII